MIDYRYSARWLHELADQTKLRILDARLNEVYLEGHIPGAVHVDLNDLRYEVNGVEGVIVPPDTFATVIGNLGIDNDTQVIIYDDHHGMLAARVAWSLMRYGHNNVGILDGGWDAWESEEYSISTEIPQISPKHFKISLVDEHDASLEWIQAHLGSSDIVFLDVRTITEYQQGTIPGSILWNWQQGTTFENTFGSLNTIRSSLSRLGVTPDKEVVTYCQSGVRAAHTFFLLQALGFDRVRMYDGSWAEWSIRVSV